MHVRHSPLRPPRHPSFLLYCHRRFDLTTQDRAFEPPVQLQVRPACLSPSTPGSNELNEYRRQLARATRIPALLTSTLPPVQDSSNRKISTVPAIFAMFMCPLSHSPHTRRPLLSYGTHCALPTPGFPTSQKALGTWV